MPATYHPFDIMSICIVREAYGMVINNRPRAICYSNTKYLPNLINVDAGCQNVEAARTTRTTYGRQQMSLLIERSKGYLRASRATLRGPGWTALRAPGLRGSTSSLSLPFSLPEPAGREMLTCLLRTRKNTLCESQSSEGR